MADYYKILGLTTNATTEEIKAAHKKLAKKFHPDLNQGDEFFANMFKQVQEAYETLSDPVKRRQYEANQGHTPSTEPTDSGNYNFTPKIEYFKADKNSFYSGNEVTFSWKVYNADYIEIHPFGIVPAIGSKTYRLNNVNVEKLEVKLIARNTYIAKEENKSITLINKEFLPPKILNFKTDREEFYNGDEVTFTWKTENATRVEIEPFGLVQPSGSKTFKINNINQEFLEISLSATNSFNNKKVFNTKKLINKLFEDIRADTPSENPRVVNQTPPRINNNRSIKNDAKLAISNFWSFKGRLSRTSYLISLIPSFIMSTFFSLILYATVYSISDRELFNDYSEFNSALFFIMAIPFIPPVFRRANDYSKNDIYDRVVIAIICIIPLINIAQIIYSTLKSGQKGINEHGPDPREY